MSEITPVINKMSSSVLNNMMFVLNEAVRLSPYQGHEIKKNWHGSSRYYSGSLYPLFNGVFFTQDVNLDFEKYLIQTNEFFVAKKVPFIWWWLQPKNISYSQQQTLDKLGYQTLGTYSGIALDINKFVPKKVDANLIKVKSMQTEKDYFCFLDILSEVFSLPDPIKQDFSHMLNSENYTHYIAEIDSMPVSVASSCYSGKIMGLYNGATLPAARKKGGFTAIAQQAILDAKQKKSEVAVGQLMATNMAQNICNDLGFVEYCKIFPYVKELQNN